MMLASLPLLIGQSIDGLLNGAWTPFVWLAAAMGLLLIVGVARRLLDTRAYGRMRVELGWAVLQKTRGDPVSTANARLTMSHELVAFLESETPILLTAIVQITAALVILSSFHPILAVAAGGASLAALAIYALSSKRFFRLNGALNAQTEQQVSVLERGGAGPVRAHLSALRRHEIRLSDTEAVVYGLIFAVLMAMLCFNLWFAAVKTGASPGRIFAIVTYSYEFLESAVVLPAALQSLTRISEITRRINGLSAPVAADR
eukprot:g649.t1